jgi:beta-lactamase superfamily II metal-dependent hydrolase
MKNKTSILKFLIDNLLGILFVLIALIGVFVEKENLPHVVFLDVGQGDAILLQDDNFQVLIDGGPDDSILFELPKYMPLLDNTVEVLVLTHAHDDHILGLLEVLEHYNVQVVLYSPSCSESSAYRYMVENYANILKEVDSTTKLDYGDIKISVLYPLKQECKENVNNESVVLDVQIAGQSILLMGDAEK